MNLRRILALGGIVAAALLGASQAHNFAALIGALHNAKWYLLLLVIPMQAWSYYASARYYQVMFGLYGSNLALKRLFEASLAVNFVQSALPTGGISGATFLSTILREVQAGTVTLVHLLKFVFTYAAYLGVLVFGFFCLYFGGGISKISIRLALLLQLVLIGAGIAVFVILIGKRTRTEWLAERGRGLVNRGSSWMRLKWRLQKSQVAVFLEEFYRGAADLRREPKRWRAPLIYSLMFLSAEIATLYVVTAALGYWLNPGAVIAAYTLANIASLVSPVTGGVGIFEATMIATLTAMGVPFAAAFSITITYRLLQFGLFLPPGLYYYRKLVHKA